MCLLIIDDTRVWSLSRKIVWGGSLWGKHVLNPGGKVLFNTQAAEDSLRNKGHPNPSVPPTEEWDHRGWRHSLHPLIQGCLCLGGQVLIASAIMQCGGTGKFCTNLNRGYLCSLARKDSGLPHPKRLEVWSAQGPGCSRPFIWVF